MPIWNQYIRPLGAKYHKLFAASSRASNLLSEVIIPSAYSEVSFRAISTCANKERSAEFAELLDGLPDHHWYDLTYFTGSLEHDEGRGLKPKERTILGRHVVFTFEYDRAELAFFCEQLDWLL